MQAFSSVSFGKSSGEGKFYQLVLGPEDGDQGN